MTRKFFQERKPDKNKQVIVKVQKPIATTDRDMSGCLVYAEGRKNITQQSITRDNFKALGKDLKGYFHASFDEDQKLWVIGNRVRDQQW